MAVQTLADYQARNESPEVVFWVGCAGSFDERAQRVSRAFASILDAAGVKYAILGTEESCTGDPAKRAGNEFLFQMMAMSNIQMLNAYDVKKIVHSVATMK
jgi:Fe-S oxidoreductase